MPGKFAAWPGVRRAERACPPPAECFGQGEHDAIALGQRIIVEGIREEFLARRRSSTAHLRVLLGSRAWCNRPPDFGSRREALLLAVEAQRRTSDADPDTFASADCAGSRISRFGGRLRADFGLGPHRLAGARDRARHRACPARLQTATLVCHVRCRRRAHRLTHSWRDTQTRQGPLGHRDLQPSPEPLHRQCDFERNVPPGHAASVSERDLERG